MAGRPPISDKLKKIRGTDQPTRLRGATVMGEQIIKPPPAPKFLSTKGKKHWRDHCRELISLGLLDSLSIPQVLALVISYTNYMEAEETLAADGRTIIESTLHGNREKVHPLQKVSNDELQKYITLARECGITQLSRLKISFTQKDKDPADDFFS